MRATIPARVGQGLTRGRFSAAIARSGNPTARAAEAQKAAQTKLAAEAVRAAETVRAAEAKRAAEARRAEPAANTGVRSVVAPSDACVPREDKASPPQLVLGGAADHAAIGHLLAVVFQSSARDEFLSSLDDPFYEPRDRLLVRRGDNIVSHVHLVRRVVRLGSIESPASVVACLATLPEFRGRGFARHLLHAAESAMRRDGSVVSLLKTSIPGWFRRCGWTVCGRHSQAHVDARSLLAQLSTAAPQRLKPLSIRPWRQVELPALMRAYCQHVENAWGPFERTEAYWRWLISRKRFDRIYVAVRSGNGAEDDGFDPPIVGYAVMKHDRILELAAPREDPWVAAQLLARACGDVIERDGHAIALDARPDDAALTWFRAAGGNVSRNEVERGEAMMVKLLDPLKLLRSLLPQFHDRAQAAGLPRPAELGIVVDGLRIRLRWTRRSAQLQPHGTGRSYIRLPSQELARLLMGHEDVREAVRLGRVQASTRVAVETARAVFPALPFWRPPWDDLSG